MSHYKLVNETRREVRRDGAARSAYMLEGTIQLSPSHLSRDTVLSHS